MKKIILYFFVIIFSFVFTLDAEDEFLEDGEFTGDFLEESGDLNFEEEFADTEEEFADTNEVNEVNEVGENISLDEDFLDDTGDDSLAEEDKQLSDKKNKSDSKKDDLQTEEWQESEFAKENLDTQESTTTDKVVGNESLSEEMIVTDTYSDSHSKEKENRYHYLYKNYYKEPLSEAIWQTLTQNIEHESYIVKSGDTLWDICKIFFDDGFFWPKLWSLNIYITNPHQINPGDEIKFYFGTIDQAPKVAIGEKGEIPEELMITDVNSDFIPPPLKDYKPVLKSFPDSIPNIDRVFKEFDETGMSIEISKRDDSLDEITEVTYFIKSSPIRPEGKVREKELEGFFAVKNQNVIVELYSKGSSGKNYYVVNEIGRINNSKDIREPDTNKKIKYFKIYEVLGEINIVKPLEFNKNNYIAEVIKSIHPLKKGSFLVAGNMPVISLLSKGSHNNVSASIIGGAYDEKRYIYGKNSFVFLDKGRANGINEGDLLPVIAKRNIRHPHSKFELKKQIGELKVAKVDDYVATAIVINNDRELQTGDYVGSVSYNMQKQDSPDSSNFKEFSDENVEFSDEETFKEDDFNLDDGLEDELSF